MALIYPLAAFVFVIIAVWFLRVYVPMPESIRTITNLVLGLIVIGIILWVINTFIPMAESIKAILNIVVVLATIVGVLQAFGLWSRVVAFWNRLRSNMLHHEPAPSRTGDLH